MKKNYIVSKSEPKLEYRIYTENSENTEGKVIFQGHKLSVETSLLESIIDFRLERSTGRIYTPDYLKDDQPNYPSLNGWFEGNSDMLSKNLNKSWETLKEKIKKELGTFRKITITIVYI